MASRHRHDFALRTVWTGAAKGPTSGPDSYSRDYEVHSQGKPAIAASTGPAYGGDPARPNPEDLLLGALSGCHLLSYLALAARAGVLVTAYEDDATCVLDMKDGRVRIVEATLRPTVTIAAGGDVEKAKKLHERAHEICFISNSVNFPVAIEPRMVVR
ncbi:MAG: OsmC family protein [Pseudomonadota bacterium]